MNREPVTGPLPEEDEEQVMVVVNEEGQYSVWPMAADAGPPAGWTDTGVSGSRRACLEHVASVWEGPRVARREPGAG
ncbi:MAG: MbtH family NRPS accessory protein [Kineosporiaceae bacterium]